MWARNVIFIGAENRVLPLDRERFRDMLAARGPLEEDDVWKLDIGEDVGAAMVERHFHEKMTLLSIEPDPVVSPVDGGWETRPVSLSTRADAAGPLLASALDDLRGSTGAGFFIENEDRVKAALEAALAAVRAERLDPAALTAAAEGLGVLMPAMVGRDEASRGAGANERLWLRGVRARGARRKAFRAAAIIRAGLPSFWRESCGGAERVCGPAPPVNDPELFFTQQPYISGEEGGRGCPRTPERLGR